MNPARAIRSDAGLPPSLWGECAKAAGYIKNRAPTRSLENKTPYEVWHGCRPDLLHLRELGCKAWVLTMTENPKILPRSVECILVGYSENSKAYRCWHRSSGRIHISWNVTFAESQDLAERSLHPGVILTEGSPVPPMDNKPAAEAEHSEQLVIRENIRHMVKEMQPTINLDAELRKSTRATRPSAAGAASKGIPHASKMDRVRAEI
jgi:hypothetical protein